jgi:hypothetical protein
MVQMHRHTRSQAVWREFTFEVEGRNASATGGATVLDAIS